MRPTSIAWYDEGEDEADWMFYNIQYSEGLKVKSYTSKDYSLIKNISYSYNNNSITKTISSQNGSSDEEIFSLSNGKIISGMGYSYQYDDNKLLKTIDGDSEAVNSWSNGNILQRTWNKSTSEYTYMDNPMYVWVQTEYEGSAEEIFENCDPFLVRQGYYGQIPSNLIKQISEYDGYNDRTDVVRYQYQLNDNGYPIQITRTSTYGGSSSETIIVKIEWEKY